MKNRLILIGICIAAVGLIALPQTLALFAGQHDFYEVSRDPDNLGVPCAKCHGDVKSELSGSDVHSSVRCEDCHVLALTYKGAKVGGNKDIHAAAAPACLDCHDGSLTSGQWHNFTDDPSVCANCHGTTTPTFGNATSILYGANESHKKFAADASNPNATLLKGANEACIGCHTHVAVDINWVKAYKMSFNATAYTKEDGSHDWIISNFTKEGTATLQTYGNMSGETTGSTTPVISISPTPPGYDPDNP